MSGRRRPAGRLRPAAAAYVPPCNFEPVGRRLDLAFPDGPLALDFRSRTALAFAPRVETSPWQCLKADDDLWLLAAGPLLLALDLAAGHALRADPAQPDRLDAGTLAGSAAWTPPPAPLAGNSLLWRFGPEQACRHDYGADGRYTCTPAGGQTETGRYTAAALRPDSFLLALEGPGAPLYLLLNLERVYAVGFQAAEAGRWQLAGAIGRFAQGEEGT